jgi:hypothetical protein
MSSYWPIRATGVCLTENALKCSNGMPTCSASGWMEPGPRVRNDAPAAQHDGEGAGETLHAGCGREVVALAADVQRGGRRRG